MSKRNGLDMTVRAEIAPWNAALKTRGMRLLDGMGRTIAHLIVHPDPDGHVDPREHRALSDAVARHVADAINTG